jgi:ATP-dependent RNA helicase SUPV3L1/SUV3
MRPIIERLLAGRVHHHTAAAVAARIRRRPQDHAPAARTAIVAFSADEVYAIAELIRRQHGGAAVVLGSLSPRTRNAQVAMFQNGDVDYLVATDAVGMGLNLDVDHVAFASDRKYDGYPVPQAQSVRVRADRGPRRRATRNGTFRHHGPLRAVRAGTGERAAEPHLRQRQNAAVAQFESWIFPRSGACRCRWRCRRA